MDYISKEENSYNKMRPDPKYMDLQPSQTWLRQWRLLNGCWICLNSMEAHQHNLWENHIPKFVHKGRNYMSLTAIGFLENLPWRSAHISQTIYCFENFPIKHPIWGILHKTHVFDFSDLSSSVQKFRGNTASRNRPLQNSSSTIGGGRCLF